MRPIQIVRAMALAHVGLVIAAVYDVTRVQNFTPISELPNTDTLVFSAMAIPPVLAAWIGSWLVRGTAARRLLVIGQGIALAVFACAFVLVLSSSDEPLAPLLLILTSLWLAGGLAVLLGIVWLVGRSERAAGSPARLQ